MEEFCRLQEELIKLERDEEISRYSNFEQSSLKILESEGVAQRKLIAESRRSTSFGRLLINFKLSDDVQNINVQPGDIVAVEQGNNRSEKLCTGVVFRVKNTGISVAVDQGGEDDDSSKIDTSHNVPCYHLVKLANNVTFKRYEKCIKMILDDARSWSGSVLCQLLEKMFGNYQGIEAKIPIVRESSLKIEYFNQKLNSSQKTAVEFSLNPDRIISAIQGPPGTGKTTTVVEILLQLEKLGLKTLCVAPSNIAVDTLLDRLSNFKNPGKVVRLGHPARIKVGGDKLVEYAVDSLLEKSHQRELANDIREELKSGGLHWREKKVLYEELRDREKRGKAEV